MRVLAFETKTTHAKWTVFDIAPHAARETTTGQATSRCLVSAQLIRSKKSLLKEHETNATLLEALADASSQMPSITGE